MLRRFDSEKRVFTSLFRRSGGLWRIICIFLLLVLSCHLVSGYITLPEGQKPPSAISNVGTGKVNPSWPSIFYASTGINYTVQIVDDPTGRSVPGCSMVYNLDDSSRGEHSPIRGDSIEFTIPEQTQAGPYWVELKYYSRESGPEMEGRHKIFVAEKLGDLSISKFEDLNNNTYWDANESCLQGWEFSITDPFGESYTRITNKEGVIYLPNVTTGEYVIREILKPGWYNTTPLEQKVKVVEKKTTYVYFGNTIPTRIIIIKFNDTNQNKVQDDGEEGLPNWEFTVTKDGNTVATCITNETGFCTLNLEEGKYTVTEHSKQCWKSTTPTSVETWVRADQPSEVKFGNYGSGTLVIHKFEDSDSDGVQDAGEKGLANWIFEVTQEGKTIDKCTTEDEGSCKLELPAGRYTITEELKKP